MIKRNTLIPLQKLLNDELNDDVRLCLIEKNEKKFTAKELDKNWRQLIASSIGASILNDYQNMYKVVYDDQTIIDSFVCKGSDIMNLLWPIIKEKDAFRIDITKKATKKRRSVIFMRA